jgi:hypothetical protein
VRVPPNPKGPRPPRRARRPAAMGRRLLQREAATARAHEERQEAGDRRAHPQAQRPPAPRRRRVRARPGTRLQVARSSNQRVGRGLGGLAERGDVADTRMEPLWSPVVATGGNQWQIAKARNPRNQAKSVATGCDRLLMVRRVSGSSPEEGS